MCISKNFKVLKYNKQKNNIKDVLIVKNCNFLDGC